VLDRKAEIPIQINQLNVKLNSEDPASFDASLTTKDRREWTIP